MTNPGHMGPVLYNPALLSREELIGSFVVRHPELAELIDRVRSAPADHAPQHVLILGWRGMGKTTLLHRLAYAIEDDLQLRKEWLPILFDEEQLNVVELADFWLNALEMLSIAAGEPAAKQYADRLSITLRDRDLEDAAFEALSDFSQQLHRRLVLLVDNVDLVLSRIDCDRESSRLREILQHEPWLMLMGTSSRAIESTYDYDQPFYEMFRVLELSPLDERQTLAMLAGLAKRYEAADVARVIEEDPAKIRKLRLLMGGNPRTVGLLFGVLQEGPAGDFRTQLEHLLDRSTSLYKDRLESLPVQAQRIFDVLARCWEAVPAAQVARELRIDRGTASGQLHRLVEKGLVEKVKLPRRALGFQVRERFFNIWYLMRGGRRSQQRLRWLVEATDLLFDVERLLFEARHLAELLKVDQDLERLGRHIEYANAIWRKLPAPSDRASLVQAALAALQRIDARKRADLFDSTDLVHLRSELIGDKKIELIDAAVSAGFSDEALIAPAFDLLRLLGRSDESFALAERVVEKVPSCGFAWREITLGHFSRSRFAEAQRALEELVRLEPTNGRTWEIAANVHTFAGDPELAMEAAARGLDVAPNSFAANAIAEMVGLPKRASEGLEFELESPVLPMAGLVLFSGFVLGETMTNDRDDEVSAEIRSITSALENGRFSPQLARMLLLLLAAKGHQELILAELEARPSKELEMLRPSLLYRREDVPSLSSLPPELSASVTRMNHELDRLVSPRFKTSTAPTRSTPAPESKTPPPPARPAAGSSDPPPPPPGRRSRGTSTRGRRTTRGRSS